MSILDHSSDTSGFWSGSPKAMFLMGLFLGLAISSIIGLAIVLGAVMNGKLATNGALAANVPSAPSPSAPTPPDPSAPSQPVKAVDEATDHTLGPKNAKVTLIEYSDFQCPFCKRHEPTLQQLLQQFPKDVRLIYRHYPLRSIHQDAAKAAEASECATKLGGAGMFWKMHDKMFAGQEAGIGIDALVGMAKSLGLDEARFKSCLTNGDTAARVQQDENSGNDAGVQGTPATFVNGRLVSGAVPFDQLKSIVQQAGAKQ